MLFLFCLDGEFLRVHSAYEKNCTSPYLQYMYTFKYVLWFKLNVVPTSRECTFPLSLKFETAFSSRSQKPKRNIKIENLTGTRFNKWVASCRPSPAALFHSHVPDRWYFLFFYLLSSYKLLFRNDCNSSVRTRFEDNSTRLETRRESCTRTGLMTWLKNKKQSEVRRFRAALNAHIWKRKFWN